MPTLRQKNIYFLAISNGINGTESGATHYRAQLELQDKGRVIKELVVYQRFTLLCFKVYNPKQHQAP